MPKKVQRKCFVCGKTLRWEDDESRYEWHHRVICRTDECRLRRAEQMNANQVRERPNDMVFREVKPWPEGIRFGKVAVPDVGRLTITRPETHRPYGTCASWAVGGGEG